jgi:hypothetical protein
MSLKNLNKHYCLVYRNYIENWITMQITMNMDVRIMRVLGFIFIPRLSSSKNLNKPAPVAGAGEVLLLLLSLLPLKSPLHQPY